MKVVLASTLKLLLCFALLAGLIVGAAEMVRSSPAAPEWAAWLVGGTAALAALWVVAGLCEEEEG